MKQGQNLHRIRIMCKYGPSAWPAPLGVYEGKISPFVDYKIKLLNAQIEAKAKIKQENYFKINL